MATQNTAPQTPARDPLDGIGVPAIPVHTAADPLSGIGVPAIPVNAATGASGTSTNSNAAPLGSRIWEGAKQFAEPVAALVKPPETPTEQVIHAISGGGGGLAAYRMAKNLVNSAENVIKATPAEYAQTAADYKRLAEDFHNHDFRNALSSAVSTGADITGITQPAMSVGTPSVRELSEAARPGGNLATPLTRDALNAVPLVLGGEAAEAGEDTAAGAAGNIVKNARVNPFRAAANKITGAGIQPALKSGIQDVWNQVADEAKVPRPTTASVQDMGQQVGDAILARSKSAYRAIDDATGNRFSGTEQALKSVNQDLRSVTNDVEEQNLMTRKIRLEMQLDQLFDDAAKAGVNKSTIDAAKADFKQAQAIYDVNHQIRMSATGVRPGMQGSAAAPEEVNAKGLLNRLNKQYNSGRLQQGVGADNAEDLIGHSAQAQKAAHNVMRNQKIAKYVAPSALGTAVAAHELIK